MNVSKERSASVLTFKALGALIDYPRAELIEAAGEISGCLHAEGLLSKAQLKAIDGLVAHLTSGELLDRQEEYVGLFDRTRSLSLHLYEHVHGDSRDRGQAMVNLQTIYNLHGYGMSCPELPDYLPMFCEFLSLIPERGARSLLGEAATILEAIRAGLDKRQSPYAAVLGALVGMADGKFDMAEVEAILRAQPEGEDSPEAIDMAWEESPVTFGPGSAHEQQGCGIAGIAGRT
jgi:nitrate reductase delta subunit